MYPCIDLSPGYKSDYRPRGKKVEKIEYKKLDGLFLLENTLDVI